MINNNENRIDNDYRRTPTPLRGEIWDAYIPKTEDGIQNSKQHGRRPVLIISNDKFNKFSPQVNVYPMTSKINKMSPVHVLVSPEQTSGLRMDSVVLCENPDSIPKTCLFHKIGEITDLFIMKQIHKAIEVQYAM